MFLVGAEQDWEELCVPYILRILEQECYDILVAGLSEEGARRERHRIALEFCEAAWRRAGSVRADQWTLAASLDGASLPGGDREPLRPAGLGSWAPRARGPRGPRTVAAPAARNRSRSPRGLPEDEAVDNGFHPWAPARWQDALEGISPQDEPDGEADGFFADDDGPPSFLPNSSAEQCVSWPATGAEDQGDVILGADAGPPDGGADEDGSDSSVESDSHTGGRSISFSSSADRRRVRPNLVDAAEHQALRQSREEGLSRRRRSPFLPPPFPSVRRRRRGWDSGGPGGAGGGASGSGPPGPVGSAPSPGAASPAPPPLAPAGRAPPQQQRGGSEGNSGRTA